MTPGSSSRDALAAESPSSQGCPNCKEASLPPKIEPHDAVDTAAPTTPPLPPQQDTVLTAPTEVRTRSYREEAVVQVDSTNGHLFATFNAISRKVEARVNSPHALRRRRLGGLFSVSVSKGTPQMQGSR